MCPSCVGEKATVPKLRDNKREAQPANHVDMSWIIGALTINKDLWSLEQQIRSKDPASTQTFRLKGTRVEKALAWLCLVEELASSHQCWTGSTRIRPDVGPSGWSRSDETRLLVSLRCWSAPAWRTFGIGKDCWGKMVFLPPPLTKCYYQPMVMQLHNVCTNTATEIHLMFRFFHDHFCCHIEVLHHLRGPGILRIHKKRDSRSNLCFAGNFLMKNCFCKLYFNLYITTNSEVQHKVTDCWGRFVLVFFFSKWAALNAPLLHPVKRH